MKIKNLLLSAAAISTFALTNIANTQPAYSANFDNSEISLKEAMSSLDSKTNTLNFSQDEYVNDDLGTLINTEDSTNYSVRLEIHGEGHNIYGQGHKGFENKENHNLYIYSMNNISDFSSKEDGGFLNNSGYAYLEGTFTNNSTSEKGGAIYNSYDANISGINGSFENNRAGWHGGAIYNYGYIDYINSNFKNNISNRSGGAIANFNRIENIYGTFENNQSRLNSGEDFGGAILNCGTIDNIYGTFRNNTASMGGAINLIEESIIKNLQGTFEDNTALLGGAIANIGSLVNIAAEYQNTTFTGNKTLNKSNAIANFEGIINFNAKENSSIIVNDGIGTDAQDFLDYMIAAGAKEKDYEDILETFNEEFDKSNNIYNINPSYDDEKANEILFNYYLNTKGLSKENFAEVLDEDAESFYQTFKYEIGLPEYTKGTVEFNNVVKRATINVFDGTLKLGSYTDKEGTKSYGTFEDVDLNLYGGTLNVIDKELREYTVNGLTSTNGKLAIDVSIENNSSDTFVANYVDGTFQLKNINISGDITQNEGKIKIINAEEVGENGLKLSDFTSMSSDFRRINFSDAGDGYLSYTVHEAEDVDLKTAVDFTFGDRAYTLKSDELITEDLGKMQSEGSILTINGNNNTIDGNGHYGIYVSKGQTLNVNDVVVQNFTGTYIDNLNDIGFIGNNGNIENLSGTFLNNTTEHAGAVLHNQGNVTTISGIFQNNSSNNGGAIYNNENIENISGKFIGNRAERNGGAIANFNYIKSITGVFEGNSTQDRNGEAAGGAIYNDGEIDQISGTFKNNLSSMAGAIANCEGFIKSIEGTFENNNALIGGAIVNTNGIVNIVANTQDTLFTGNTQINEKNALINIMGMVNLNAQEGKSIIFNDGIGFNKQDLYNYFNELGMEGDMDDMEGMDEYDRYYGPKSNYININATTADGTFEKSVLKFYINMSGLTEEEYEELTQDSKDEYIQQIAELQEMIIAPDYKEGTIEINNLVKNTTLNMFDGTLKLGSNVQDDVEYFGTFDKDVLFNYYGGKVTLQNEAINHANFGNMTLFNEMDLSLDADLKAEKIDTISADSFTANDNKINITNINLLSATNKKSLSLSPLSEDMNADVRATMAENIIYSGGEVAYGDIYKYVVEYDPENANLNFNLQGDGKTLNDYAPAVMANPIAQAGAQSIQINSFGEAFKNMDSMMLMPTNERLALKYQNKYASEAQSIAYDPTMSVYQNNTAWFRPYTTFENVPLKHGPKVSNVSYGSYFGYDSSLHELGKGWDGTLGIYAGYTGSHQAFHGNSIYQNGGSLGIMAAAYKGNFFTGWTINTGASAGSVSSVQGSDNFASIMGGISTKTGYNIEFADGKFIIQPSALLSYSMINTFDYTNAAGVRMKSDPLHTIQIEPAIKLIGNIGTWQPYANVSMVWNALNETKVTANDVKLPEVSVKPYVKYGVGLQKRWGDRFTGYGQAYVTNGGRNGIGLQAGLRIALGNETLKPKAAWLTPKKKDTTIVIDSRVK